VDLREEIEVDVGGEGVGAEGVKYWEEYSGKQMLLSTFFERGGAGSGAGKEAESGASKDERGDDRVAGEPDMTLVVGRWIPQFCRRQHRMIPG
jgi:hypothetical protein